jgi:hypothetical protein
VKRQRRRRCHCKRLRAKRDGTPQENCGDTWRSATVHALILEFEKTSGIERGSTEHLLWRPRPVKCDGRKTQHKMLYSNEGEEVFAY